MSIRNNADEVLAFWNARAWLGTHAGSRDVVLKQLEVQAIASYVKDGMRILDAGCGNGITAVELATRHRVSILGIDFAEEMVSAAAKLAAEARLSDRVRFQVGDIRSSQGFPGPFDMIYTERLLINLPDWASQRDAIVSLTSLLAPGGQYVMCEHSQEGLAEMNEWRERIGLTTIEPPWHNRYLRDAEIAGLQIPDVSLVDVNYFSSTYYLLSRIANAHLAALEGSEPDYDSPLNLLALRLPSIGRFGQGRIWLWQRSAA